MNNMTIKDYPEFERPYERMLKFGESALSNAELLAVIIRSGTRNKNSVEVIRELLLLDKNDDGILFLDNLLMEELMSVNGIGMVKALQIKAVIEFSKRMNAVTAKKRIKVNEPKVISDYLMSEMRSLEHEQLRQVLLNSRNEIIRVITVSKGGINRTDIDSREIFKEAFRSNANSIILVHNHPTGDPEPSKMDISVTKDFMKASELVGITLLDHIIIGNGRYVSMREKKYI